MENADEAAEKEREEAEEEMVQLEAAIAQSLYLRYGLDVDYRNKDWGGPATVSSSEKPYRAKHEPGTSLHLPQSQLLSAWGSFCIARC